MHFDSLWLLRHGKLTRDRVSFMKSKSPFFWGRGGGRTHLGILFLPIIQFIDRLGQTARRVVGRSSCSGPARPNKLSRMLEYPGHQPLPAAKKSGERLYWPDPLHHSAVHAVMSRLNIAHFVITTNTTNFSSYRTHWGRSLLSNMIRCSRR